MGFLSRISLMLPHCSFLFFALPGEPILGKVAFSGVNSLGKVAECPHFSLGKVATSRNDYA